jgi:hypothetical protein
MLSFFSSEWTLKKIITEEIEKSGVPTNSISLETVRCRVKGGNLDAF